MFSPGSAELVTKSVTNQSFRGDESLSAAGGPVRLGASPIMAVAPTNLEGCARIGRRHFSFAGISTQLPFPSESTGWGIAQGAYLTAAIPSSCACGYSRSEGPYVRRQTASCSKGLQPLLRAGIDGGRQVGGMWSGT